MRYWETIKTSKENIKKLKNFLMENHTWNVVKDEITTQETIRISIKEYEESFIYFYHENSDIFAVDTNNIEKINLFLKEICKNLKIDISELTLNYYDFVNKKVFTTIENNHLHYLYVQDFNLKEKVEDETNNWAVMSFSSEKELFDFLGDECYGKLFKSMKDIEENLKDDSTIFYVYPNYFKI